ncbi:MAG: hypothetical protein Q8N51_03985 [Gammaproteobacteria bacterium]|nr:hypothetical protein [Gammaproteobacteria bacterium]
MSALKFQFNAGAFGKTFVAMKAKRGLAKFFAVLPNPILAAYIAQDKLLADYLPPQYRGSLLGMLKEYRDLADAFTNDEVYAWIPEATRKFVESFPTGRAWAAKQLAHIRYLMTS